MALDKQNKKELQKAADLVERAMTIVASVRDEQQETYDDLSERAQEGAKGEELQELLESLETAHDHLDDAGSAINELI